jgi:hypothetical protein
MSRGRVTVVLCAAFAFWLAHSLEALLGREDWPLSGYPMYATRVGRVATRAALVGVSDEGEFPLTRAHTAPFTGSRLQALMNKMRDQRARKRFFQKLAARYRAQREQRGWPELRAIRLYTESWTVHPRLEGIDSPSRELRIEVSLDEKLTP